MKSYLLRRMEHINQYIYIYIYIYAYTYIFLHIKPYCRQTSGDFDFQKNDFDFLKMLYEGMKKVKNERTTNSIRQDTQQ